MRRIKMVVPARAKDEDMSPALRLFTIRATQLLVKIQPQLSDRGDLQCNAMQHSTRSRKPSSATENRLARHDVEAGGDDTQSQSGSAENERLKPVGKLVQPDHQDRGTPQHHR